MRNLIIGLVLLASTTTGARKVYAQETVPNVSIGARNTSLANSNISESSDVSVMYENPAAIAYLKDNSLFIDHTQMEGSPGMRENLAVPVVLTTPLTVALGLDAYHFGFLGGAIPADQRILEYGYDIAAAVEVTPTLSIGGSSALRHAFSGNGSQAWGSYFSLGADYVPTPDLSYSIVWGGLGRDVALYPEAGETGMTAAGAPTSTYLEVGATMTYPSSASLRPPLFVFSLASEKILRISGHYYKGGLELRPLKFLELRVGYMAGPGVTSTRFGLGIVENLFSIQYAIYPAIGATRLLQQVSVSLEM